MMWDISSTYFSAESKDINKNIFYEDQMILRKHVSSKINEAVLLVLDRFLSELCPVIAALLCSSGLKAERSWGCVAVGTAEDDGFTA